MLPFALELYQLTVIFTMYLQGLHIPSHAGILQVMIAIRLPDSDQSCVFFCCKCDSWSRRDISTSSCVDSIDILALEKRATALLVVLADFYVISQYSTALPVVSLL